MNLRVKLDNKERGYYASLYQAVDANVSIFYPNPEYQPNRGCAGSAIL